MKTKVTLRPFHAKFLVRYSKNTAFKIAPTCADIVQKAINGDLVYKKSGRGYFEDYIESCKQDITD